MGDALLIYDGDCGFCTSVARWAERSWRDGERAIPWQELGEPGLAGIGLTSTAANQAAWWVSPDGTLAGGHLAVAAALRAGSGWRRCAGAVIAVPPLSWLAPTVYRLVARNRHLLGRGHCTVEPGRRG